MTEVRAFQKARATAKTRGVEWLLSFDEWIGVWHQSGKFHLRGRKRGEYCMSRFGDVGPYAIGNVFINLSSENVSAGSRGLKRTPEQNAARSEFMRGNKNLAGLRWVSKDGISVHVKGEDLHRLLLDGWKFGRTSIHGKRRNPDVAETVQALR